MYLVPSYLLPDKMMEGELYASDANIVEWNTYPYIVVSKKIIITIAASTGIISFFFFFCL